MATTGAELLDRLAAMAAEAGYSRQTEDGAEIFEKTLIDAAWALGRRRVVSRLRLTTDDRTRRLDLIETLIETAWGLPPPRLWFRAWRQRGLAYRESGREAWPGGAGDVTYGGVGARLAVAAREAGWMVETVAPTATGR